MEHPLSTQSSSTSIVNLNEGNSDLDSDSPTGVAIHNGVAYIGTSDDGLNRYIIENNTFLGSWVSTGINDVDFAPVAIYGTNPQILHMGLPGYGVARKDLSTGEILIPLTVEPDRGNAGSTEVLPSSQCIRLGRKYCEWRVYTSVQATVQLSGMVTQPQPSAKAAVGIYNLTNILISYSMAQLHTQQQILAYVNTVKLQFKIV